MRTVRSAILVGGLVSSACARTISGSASNITQLEAARATDPKSETIQRSLGIAYFNAKRFDEARTTMQHAMSMQPSDGVVALFLGLTAEAQDDLPAARTAYESYIRVGRTRGVKKQINDRLMALARKENEASAKRAVAQERQLSSVPGPPNTVAVLPFVFSGSDTSLKPLERGFAELVTTDLSRSSALTVLERARLQALLDEMQLQQGAGVQAGTGVRAGKMLQAGRLVGGTISQAGADQILANAFVTDVQTTKTIGKGSSGQQPLDDLFSLEKTVVLSLFSDLGVTLTTAERIAIEQRPTRSLAAFLAYSHGLELQDEGRFDEAGRFFDNAVRIDPSFGAARQKSQDSKSASAGTRVTATSVESGLKGTSEGAAVSAVTQGAGTSAGTALAAADGLNPSAAAGATSGGTTTTQPVKDAAAGTGADNPTTKSAKVTIVLHQPSTGKP